MKVLLIDVYNYVKGGAETVCFNTGDILQRNGHEVVYFTLKWDKNNVSSNEKFFPKSKETQNPPFRTLKNIVNYFWHFEAAKKLQQLIKEEKPDIAHIHLMWGQLSASILPVLKRNNIPIVYTVHDYRLVCPAYTFRNGYNEICEKCKGKSFYNCILNKCTKGSRFLSIMMASEQYFRNIFHHPTKYINGFIYVSNFARSKQEQYMSKAKTIPAITLYNMSMHKSYKKVCAKEKYLLYFGRLSYEKGIKTLLNAIVSHQDIKLKVIGTGPIDEDLRRWVNENKINNVDFLGYKSGDELKKLVAEAYFVIVPSEWYENNPMTIIEAYSVGTPVIGAMIGGIPEIIQNGKTGYLFKSGDISSLEDTIVLAYSLSQDAYSEISYNALVFADVNFNVDKYYEQLIDFYVKISNSIKG